MITDRTYEDVNRAKSIRSGKVQKGISLTEEEIAIMERGSATVDTLNRIENKQKELKTIFNSIGYWNTPIVNKEWTYNDIFKEADFKRIIENDFVLKRAFFSYPYTPNKVSALYHYNEFNSLEKILADLETMLRYVQENFKECDTFNCGEENA